MLTNETLKILSRIYRYENSEYDFEKKVYFFHKPDTLNANQIEFLKSIDFELNRITEYEHDVVINELKSIVKIPDLEYIVSNLFIKAIGSGFNRGIQPIFSYYFAKNMVDHGFEKITKEGFEKENICKSCGLHKKKWINDSETRFHFHIGYCRLGGYAEILLDLKEVPKFKLNVATIDEKNIFYKVLDVIEKAQMDETPSGLIKRLSKERCLQKSNNTSRTWIVKCLAELGILRNSYDENYSIMNAFVPYDQKLEWELNIHRNSPARADVEFPISAWRGALGVNRTIANKIIDNANIL